MKLFPVFLLALSSLSTFVNAGEFSSPQPYETLYSGLSTTVKYDPSRYTDNDTVAIFFDEDRSHLLASGPAKQGSFSFIVPEDALTPEGRNSSTLLAVFRRNLYLWDVDNVPVMVEMPPVNGTSTDASSAPLNDSSSDESEQQQNTTTEGTA